MKISSAALALLLGVSIPALADEPAAPGPRPVCLEAGQIDHTVVVDDQTILYYMRGQKIWKNTLRKPCHSLKFEQAFSEEVRGQICSNGQMIRVMQTGTQCFLGDFTPYTPPVKTPAQ